MEKSNQEVKSEIEATLADPATSNWLKNALRTAMDRDPLDAARDADRLADILNAHCEELMKAADK